MDFFAGVVAAVYAAMRDCKTIGPMALSVGSSSPDWTNDGTAAMPRSSSDLPGGKMLAAAWKSGFSSVECADGEVVLADHNSPPAISVALLDSVKSFCKTARRADVGRWCSMYAVTGSDSKASTSVDVAGKILDAEVERVTWTGRRGFEDDCDWAGACFVVFVDILETWSGDVRKCGM